MINLVTKSREENVHTMHVRITQIYDLHGVTMLKTMILML